MVRMKFRVKLVVKMNELGLNREEIIGRRKCGRCVVQYKEGVISAAIEACGVRRSKGQE